MKPGATFSSRAVTITLGIRKPGWLRTAVVQPLAACADPAPAIAHAATAAANAPAIARMPVVRPARSPVRRLRNVLVDGYRGIPARVLASHRARGAEHVSLRIECLG